MKKKMIKNSIVVALLTAFCISPLAGCASADNTMAVGEGLNAANSSSSEVKVPKYYTVPNDFRLVAYGTPPNTEVMESEEAGQYAGTYKYNTVANWQTLRDCGFTYAQPSHYETEDDVMELAFKNADAVNAANPDQEPLKVLLGSYDFINPYSLGAVIKQGGTYQEAMARIREIEDRIKARYDTFMQYESCAGIFATDEPSAHMFEAIAAAQDWFEWNYPEYEFYVNLFPEYASDQQLFGDLWVKGGEYDFSSQSTRHAAFNKYIEMFCDIVTPYIVSYDHYCVVSSETIPGFFYNLASAATNAKALEDKMDVEIPFYIYLQSEGFEGKMQIDNYERWAWQCYTSMAFGVTGIQAFCYWAMLAEKDEKGYEISDAIVSRYGEKTPLYDIVKQTNADLKALEDVYMAYNWEGARGWWNNNNSYSNLMKQLRSSGLEINSYQDISAVTIKSNANLVREFLIGQFANRLDGNKKAYMVTNASHVNDDFDLEYPNALIDLTFGNGITHVDVYKPGANGVAERIALNNGVLSLSIPTGEGFFVVPVTE